MATSFQRDPLGSFKSWCGLPKPLIDRLHHRNFRVIARSSGFSAAWQAVAVGREENPLPMGRRRFKQRVLDAFVQLIRMHYHFDPKASSETHTRRAHKYLAHMRRGLGWRLPIPSSDHLADPRSKGARVFVRR